jgi:hypothetical protein
MEWPHDSNLHCSNLVPNEIDFQLVRGDDDEHHEKRDDSEPKSIMTKMMMTTTESIPVNVTYAVTERQHPSLIHHWNDFNATCMNVTFPRVIVRFEDLIFHPRSVIETVCTCADGELIDPSHFRYIVNSAKVGEQHGQIRTGYVDAIILYGRGDQRWLGTMTDADRNYATQHLNHQLMDLFEYRYPEFAVPLETTS